MITHNQLAASSHGHMRVTRKVPSCQDLAWLENPWGMEVQVPMNGHGNNRTL